MSDTLSIHDSDFNSAPNVRKGKCPGCDSEIVMKEIMNSTTTEMRFEVELMHVQPIKHDEAGYLCRLVMDSIKRELPGYTASLLHVMRASIGQMRAHMDEQADRSRRILAESTRRNSFPSLSRSDYFGPEYDGRIY